MVGAGQAGVELAVSLRQGGYQGTVTLVGAESHAPYQRPPLSKGYLAGDGGTLTLRPAEFYRAHGIEVLRGVSVVGAVPVVGADPGHLVTDDGTTIAYDRLAITTGAGPRRLDVPGDGLPGVHYLRTVDDSDRLRAIVAAPGTGRIVVVGGGFIGLEVAAVARTLGRRVTVVEAAPRLMPRAVAPVVSDFYAEAHLRRGVEIRLGTGVVALHGDDRLREVELSDGTRLPADVAVVGVGIVPRTELATSLGLRVEGGIVVDAAGRTSDGVTVAAGDCVVAPHPLTGDGLVRLESVPGAVAQARVAAATLLGRPLRAAAVPWFWSDQYDLKLQIAGLADGHDATVVRRDGDTLAVLYYRGETLLAVHAVNRVADYVAVRKALAARATIPAASATDPATPLAGLARPVTPAPVTPAPVTPAAPVARAADDLLTRAEQ